MYKVYKYLFYKLYCWYLNTFGEKDGPHHNAALIISLLTYCNILTIFSILQKITHIEFLWFGGWNIKYLALLAILYYAFHHFVLLHNKRFIKIIKEFEGESNHNRKIGNLWVAIYIVFTFIAVYFSMGLGLY